MQDHVVNDSISSQSKPQVRGRTKSRKQAKADDVVVALIKLKKRNSTNIEA
jgi:hypothetical protein